MADTGMLEIEFSYYAWATLLVLASFAAWTTNFLALPSNWFIVGFAALFVSGMDTGAAAGGLNWDAVILLGVMAAGGEVAEFVAGAVGASKEGGSRRGVVLALVGTTIGGFLGMFMAIPIPILGPLIGALAGGAAGAFAGAYLGEMWKHGRADQSVRVGTGAAVGRVLGTLAKVLIGLVMVVVLAVRVYSG